MTDTSGFEGQGSESGNDQGQQQQSQQIDNSQQGQQSGGTINPAWNDLLGVVPSQLHSQVTPHLQKWDSNFQTKVNEVHSQYEGWKPFIDGGVNPQDVDFALGLLNAVSTNPQEVLSALQEWIDGEGDGGSQNFVPDEQGQQFNSPDGLPDISQHPAYQELESAVQTMAQILLGQREEEQQTLAEQQLEQELSSLKDQYGEFDERYVLGLAMNDENISLEDAVKEFHSLSENILSGKRKPGPPILGSGGASPASQVNPAQMGPKDTRALVAQMLQQAQGQ